MNKEKKVNIINVYLSYEDKKILSDLKNKYHVSYSTIAEKIGQELWTKSGNIFLDHYLYTNDRSTKTSIKPRMEKDLREYFSPYEPKVTMYFTNVIKAFTRNEIGKWTGWNEKEVNKRRSRIHNILNNTYDPNWDGNDFSRKLPKFIKQNPKYVKKLLGDE